jgi:hypothetical protein
VDTGSLQLLKEKNICKLLKITKEFEQINKKKKVPVHLRLSLHPGEPIR